MKTCLSSIEIRIRTCLPLQISDKLWDKITDLLPDGKPNNMVGRPVIPFRKVFNGIFYVLRTGYQWKILLLKDYGSGSTCHQIFQQWDKIDKFKKIWVKLLKEYVAKEVSDGYGNL